MALSVSPAAYEECEQKLAAIRDYYNDPNRGMKLKISADRVFSALQSKYTTLAPQQFMITDARYHVSAFTSSFFKKSGAQSLPILKSELDACIRIFMDDDTCTLQSAIRDLKTTIAALEARVAKLELAS